MPEQKPLPVFRVYPTTPAPPQTEFEKTIKSAFSGEKTLTPRQQAAKNLLDKAQSSPETLTPGEATTYLSYVKEKEKKVLQINPTESLKNSFSKDYYSQYTKLFGDMDLSKPITSRGEEGKRLLASEYRKSFSQRLPLLNQAEDLYRKRDFENLYKLADSFKPASAAEATPSTPLYSESTYQMLKQMADTAKLTSIMETELKGFGVQDILGSKKAMQSLGKEILASTQGSALYGEGMKEAFSYAQKSNFSTSEGIQRVLFEAETTAKDVLMSKLQNDYLETRKNLAKLNLYNIDNPQNPVSTKEEEEQLNALEQNIRAVEGYTADVKKNYPLFYKRSLQEAQDMVNRNLPFAYNPGTQLQLTAKAIGKTLYNRVLDIGTFATHGFNPTDYNLMKTLMSKYHKTGYVIGTDSKGNPVESSQFYWKDEDGNRHVNGLAILESGIPVAEQMVETIFLGEGLGLVAKSFIGGLTKLAAASETAGIAKSVAADLLTTRGIGAAKSMSNILKNPALTQRLQTFASVFATTYPTYFLAESNNFKDSRDARNISLLRASVEGATESFSPNTPDLFKRGVSLNTSYAKTLSAGLSSKITGMFPGISNKALRRLLDSRIAKRVAGATGDIFQEGVVEEELSLLGNHFVDNLAQNKERAYQPQNELTWDNVMSTAIESTASMLITAPFMGGGSKRAENYAVSSARWSIANNPEIYKSYVKNLVNLGKISQEEAVTRLSKIDSYSSYLNSLPTKMSSVRDLKTLLEDKDKQQRLFSLYLDRDAILSQPEVADEETYKKELETIDAEIYKIKKQADKYDSLSVEDKKEIIHNNLKSKINDILDTEDYTPFDLYTMMAGRKDELAANPEVFTEQMEQHISDLQNTQETVKRRFLSFLKQNNKDLTFEQLQHKKALLELNQEFLSKSVYDKYNQILDDASIDAALPLFQITDQEEFINTLAKNLVTDRPLVTKGKPFRQFVASEYFNDTIFDSLLKDTPEDQLSKEKEKLKTKLWEKVKELKVNKTEEQTFPEVPISQIEPEIEVPEEKSTSTEEIEPAKNEYEQTVRNYKEVLSQDPEEAFDIKKNLMRKILSVNDPQEFVDALSSSPILFSRESINEVLKEFTETPFITPSTKISSPDVMKAQFLSKLKELFPAKFEETKVEEVVEPTEEVEDETTENRTPEEKEEDEFADNVTKVQQEVRQQSSKSELRNVLPTLTFVDVKNQKTLLDDPYTALFTKVLDNVSQYSDPSASPFDLHVIVGPIGKIYKKILPQETLDTLVKFSKGEVELTLEEFKDLLTVNGVPIHDSLKEDSFVPYVHKNPAELTKAVVATFSNSKGEVINFDVNGNPGKGTPLITTIRKKDNAEGAKILQSISESKNVLIYPVTNSLNGIDITDSPIPTSANLEIALTTEVDPNKKFTKLAGVTYVISETDKQRPYKNVILKKTDNPEALIALVEAYNNGTAPPLIQKLTPNEFTAYFKTYAFLPQRSETRNIDIDITQKKDGTFDKINLRRKIQGKEKVIWRNIDFSKEYNHTFAVDELKKAYRNIDRGILTGKFPQLEKFPPLTFENNQLGTSKPMAYRSYISSDQFGATYRTVANRALAFSPTPLTQTEAKETEKEITAMDLLAKFMKPEIPTEDVKSKLEEDEGFYSVKFAFDNKISKQQADAAKAWVESHPIFRKSSFIFESTTEHPLAYAKWTRYGIILFKGATYAEAYHEAWHEFSQYYLTPEQLANLYREARKKWPKAENFFELEEKLAEEFRLYALDQKPVGKLTKIFQEILEFLRALFNEKPTIDRYFGTLYRGGFGFNRRQRNRVPNMYENLYSSKKLTIEDELSEDIPEENRFAGEIYERELSFLETQNILEAFDSLFVEAGNSITAEKNLDASFLNALFRSSTIERIYTRIQEDLNTLAEKQMEQGIPSDTVNKINNNFDRIKEFHKRNSLLFSKDIRNEFVEDEEEIVTNEQFALFDKAVNELSQKDYAPEIVVNMIRILPMVDEDGIVNHQELNIPRLGSFDNNWTILQKTLKGAVSYQEMLEKIETLSKTQPQFKTLLRILPKKVTSKGNLVIKNSFFNTFSQPYIPSIILDVKTGDDYILKPIFSSSTQNVKIRSDWDSLASVATSEFRVLTENAQTYNFDLNSFLEAFPNSPTNEEELERFLKGLGFNFNPAAISLIKDDFKKGKLANTLNYIHSKLTSLKSVKQWLSSPLAEISKPHRVGKKPVNSQKKAVDDLINYEIESRPEFIGDMHFTAANTKSYAFNPPTYMSKIQDILNDTKNYPTRDDVFKRLPQLNPRHNTFVSNSYFLNYLFNEDGTRKYIEGVSNQLELYSHNGMNVDNEGEKLLSVPTAVKLAVEIQSMLDPNIRIEEIARLSGKATTRSLRMSSNNTLWEFEAFQKGVPPFVMQTLLNYLKTEIDVTKKPSVSSKTSGKQSFFEANKYNKSNVPNLGFFFNILDSETRQDVFNVINEDIIDAEEFLRETNPELLRSIVEQINKYFKGRAERLAEDIQPAIKNKPAEWGFTQGNLIPKLFHYSVISFIHRVEQYKLIFFHPYYYKDAKDVEKRLSAWNAYGTFPVMDEENLNFVTLTGQELFDNYAKEKQIQTLPRIASNDEFQYLVFADNPVVSKTAFDHKEDYKKFLDKYTKDTSSKKQDAAAIATLDFFKKFYSLSTGWTDLMEKEYSRQMQIWDLLLKRDLGENVEPKLTELLDTERYFTFNIKKLQYAGFGLKAGEAIPVFHKYSIKTVLPSLAVDDPQLFGILKKLYSSSADYGVFTSGTKVAETVEPSQLFTDNKVNSSPVPSGVAKFEYLKEQQVVENKETLLAIFATQFRKLLFKDLETKEEKELFQSYHDFVRDLIDHEKTILSGVLDNPKKLAQFLIKEISKKDIAESTKDFIKLRKDGNFEFVLDSFIERTTLESALISAVKNRIVKQKFPGTQSVQFPVSLIRPSLNLKFYRKGPDGSILPAECLMQFNEKYYSLLSLIGEPLDEYGFPLTPYTSLKKLNEALKNPEFVKNNFDALTVTAVRIPTQGPNSMEHFVIKEFLPEEEGQIIAVPDEMVVKSGSDYDIDKLFVYQTSLDDQGKPVYRSQTIASEVVEMAREAKRPMTLEALQMQVEDELEPEQIDQRVALQNEILRTVKKRLSQEEIFEDLIEPNNVEDIDRLADKFEEALMGTEDDLRNMDSQALRKRGKISNWSNLANPAYQARVFELNKYKSSLSNDAKINTFQALVQQSGLTLINKDLNKKYLFPANRENGNVVFYKINTVGGQKISNIENQFISGHVDIEKNDNIARIGFGKLPTSVGHYMFLAGTDLDYVANLINTPATRRYARDEDSLDIFKSLAEEEPSLEHFLKNKTEGKEVAEHVMNFLSSDEKEAKVFLGGIEENRTSPRDQFFALAYFIEMETQSQNMTTLSLSVDFDTLSPQNFETYYRKYHDVEDLKNQKIFNPEALDYLTDSSLVSPFKVDPKLIAKFEKIFPVSISKKISEEIIKTYNKFANRRLVEFDSYSRKFKNALLTSIWSTYVPEVSTYVQYMEVTNPDNVVLRASRIKEKHPKLKHIILDNLVVNASPDSNYLSLGLGTSDLTYSVDIFKEAFREGLDFSKYSEEENNEIKEFFRIFAHTGILSTQLSKTRNSYLHIIPEEFYTPIMEQRVREFTNELKAPSSTVEKIEAQVDLFVEERVTPSTTKEERQALREEGLELLSSYNEANDFFQNFFIRFKQQNQELFSQKVKLQPNPALKFFRDYNISRESLVPPYKSQLSISPEELASLPDLQTATQSIAIDKLKAFMQSMEDDTFEDISKEGKENKDNC